MAPVLSSSRENVPVASVEVTEAEIADVSAVLRSGRLRQGAICLEFEEKFAGAVGSSHAVAVSSGTAALHLAWLALLEPGDEVLVPAFSFFATASSVLMAGAKPVFCDVDPQSGAIDVSDARRRVGTHTRGIAPVHLYGAACNVEGVTELAQEYRLKVLWDAAQAHGTRFRGKDIGGLDNASCYSFYATKTMTTGEGGMVTTNDGELAERVRLLRSHGESGRYVHTALGYNYRMTDIQAAIGVGQLSRLAENVRARRKNAEQLNLRLAGLPGVLLPFEPEGTEHAYHQYTIQIDPNAAGISRDDVAKSLAASGIGTAIHYPRPLHRQPLFLDQGNQPDLPASERLAERVLSLPVHPQLHPGDIEHIAEAIWKSIPAASAT